MRHTHGVTVMRWCAWLLLAITTIFLALYLVQQCPRPYIAPGLYPRNVTPGVDAWAEWGVFCAIVLGSVAVWALAALRSKFVWRSTFVLAVAFLYCILAVPFTTHRLLGLGGSDQPLFGDYPKWAKQALIAILIFGWAAGALFVICVGYCRVFRWTSRSSPRCGHLREEPT